MNIESIKSKIVDANNAYRSGNPEMTDQEYDALVDEYKNLASKEEYDEFRNSLNEGRVEYGTKVRHPYVMGSLDKVTIEKPDDIFKFIKKHCTAKLNVSAKVDGISCRLHYSNGKLVQASTRGNGEEGIDITDKIEYVKYANKTISIPDDIDIRGELVILKSDFEKMSGFANPRNATAGIMNRKEWTKEDVSNVSFIPYTVLGPAYSKEEQFKLLEDNKFNVAWHDDYSIDECNSKDFIGVLENLITKEHDYETDGLVIADATYHNEEKYRPDASVAVKGNMNFAITRIIDVDWRGPSKSGKFVPVAQLEPVEICGTTVSQATMNNLDFIAKMNLKYGSIVKVQKRGEIVPAIIELVSNDKACDIAYPEYCPCCGSKLEIEGPFIWCKNKNCSAQTLHQLVHFIKKLDVKNASEATLKNFNINSFRDLVAFVPDKKYKMQVKLYDELQKKVFSKSKKDLFIAMDFDDLSTILLGKLVDFYSLEKIELSMSAKCKPIDFFKTLPDGIGEITLDKFANGLNDAFANLEEITSDSRWNPVEEVVEEKSEIVGSICVTGSLKFGSRSKFLEFARKHGYEAKGGVTNGLTYLVNNDINSTSSKNKKAKELGIKIITEDDFMELVQDSTTGQDLDSL